MNARRIETLARLLHNADDPFHIWADQAPYWQERYRTLAATALGWTDRHPEALPQGGQPMSAEPDTPEGRLRWFSEHGDETWLPSPHFDAAFVLLALDVARAERDAARADLADLRRRVTALADEMAEDIDASDHQWDKGWDAAGQAHSIDLRALIACPTCGGTAWVDWTDDHPGGICPDCTKETP